MKNFLDLKATKSQYLQIELVLNPVVENGTPFIELDIGDNIIFCGYIREQKILKTQVNIESTFDIKITLINKIYDPVLETAVMLDCVVIDNISVIPEYVHLAEYDNDHDYANPTHYIGFNGTWKLSINQPFYQWIHNIKGQGWLLVPD